MPGPGARIAVIGAHWIGPGNPRDLLDLCASAQQAGAAVPYAVICNEDKAVAQVRAVSPGTKILFRITGRDGIPNPGYDAGVQRMRELAPYFYGVGADVYSIANEWLPKDNPAALAAGAQTYIGAMDEAERWGLKLCVGDLNTGHPDLSNPANLDALRPMLERAEGLHYLNVHYYALGGNPTGDPDAMLWRWLVADYPDLAVLISEYGALENNQAIPHGEAFTRMLTVYGQMLALYSQVKGVAVYSLTAGPWPQCNWYSEKQRYQAWLAGFNR